jgi:hypothetical protein
MTTTRINHTGHNHPSTTAARTACRKATPIVASPSNVVGVRGGKVHLGTADEFPVCRTGGQDSGRTHYRTTDAAVTCKGCGA